MSTEHTRPGRAARLHPEALHVADLRSALDALRSEAPFATSGRNGTTLVKNPQLRVVLEAMTQGACLAEHHAPGPITVQVLEGEIELWVGETAHTLTAGALLVLPARIPHSVRAVRDAAFLLTIVPSETAAS